MKKIILLNIFLKFKEYIRSLEENGKLNLFQKEEIYTKTFDAIKDLLSINIEEAIEFDRMYIGKIALHIQEVMKKTGFSKKFKKDYEKFIDLIEVL